MQKCNSKQTTGNKQQTGWNRKLIILVVMLLALASCGKTQENQQPAPQSTGPTNPPSISEPTSPPPF